LTVTIKVVSVDYDGDAECRCKGTCCSENPHIPLGAFHTIVLEPGTQLTLSKPCWDVLDIKRLEEAADAAASSDLAIVLITEGVAHVCLIGKSRTSLRSKVTLYTSCMS
jgi:protein pelota